MAMESAKLVPRDSFHRDGSRPGKSTAHHPDRLNLFYGCRDQMLEQSRHDDSESMEIWLPR